MSTWGFVSGAVLGALLGLLVGTFFVADLLRPFTNDSIRLGVETFTAMVLLGAAIVGLWELVDTRRIARARLIAELREAYAQREMLDALETLRDWEENHPADFAQQFRPNDLEHRGLNRARRHVSHYFQNIHAMWKDARLLNDEFVRYILSTRQVEFYCRVIEPLEERVRDGYDPRTFQDFAALYGISRPYRGRT